MVDGATQEQLQDVVNEHDTETSIADMLAETIDESGMTFADDPAPKPEVEDKDVEDKPNTEDTPDLKAEDKPDGDVEASDDKESVPDSEAAKKPPEDADQDKTDQANDIDEKDAPGSLTPPSSWSAEEKAEFTDLPSKVQNVILRREGDRDKAMHQKQAEMNRTSQQYADMDRVIEPIKDKLALAGTTPATLFSQYLATSKALQDNPIETLKYLAHSYNVDLSKLNEVAAGEEPSPDVIALRKQLEDTNARLNTFTSSQDEQTAAYQQQRQDELAGTLESFSNEADTAGNLKHPHFNELRGAMGSLMSAAIQAGQTLTMEDAYQQALWANPSHREAMIAQQNKASKERSDADRKEHAKKAGRAGTSVSSAPGGGQPPKPQGTILEELSRAYDDVAAQ